MSEIELRVNKENPQYVAIHYIKYSVKYTCWLLVGSFTKKIRCRYFTQSGLHKSDGERLLAFLYR